MLIRLWGTRGSIPANGARFSRYGGMTSCIEVRTDENDVIIIDAGTGIRDLGKSLMPELENGSIRSLHLLLSHWHLDHIQGLPFFTPVYNKESGLVIHAALDDERLDLKTALGRLFDGLQFPLQWKDVPSHALRDFTAGDELQLGSARVTTCPTCHPGGCTAFRITADGWSFAFTGDHEIPLDERKGISSAAATDRLFSFLAGADVVLADAHFTEHDHQAHPGWGHSDFAQWPKPLAERGVRHLIYTHYCPDYTDMDIDRSLAELHASYDGLPMTIQAGQQGASIDREGLVDEGGNEAEHCEICDFLPYLSGHAESHTMLTTILRQARDFTGADAGTIYL
ncbi:MAG: MBL fold metallo-hydrolase, partial [Desulfovibrio sp.]|nr:MBL fold metallo-hydrolase [Desulfovibrio sp.]